MKSLLFPVCYRQADHFCQMPVKHAVALQKGSISF